MPNILINLVTLEHMKYFLSFHKKYLSCYDVLLMVKFVLPTHICTRKILSKCHVCVLDVFIFSLILTCIYQNCAMLL